MLKNKALSASSAKKKQIVFGVARTIDRFISFDVTNRTLNVVQTVQSSTLFDGVEHISVNPAENVLYVASQDDIEINAFNISRSGSISTTVKARIDVSDLVGLDFSTKRNVLVVYRRTASDVIVEVRDKDTLAVIASDSISGGTLQYSSHTNLDDARDIFHVAFYKGASLYDQFVAAFKITDTSVNYQGIRTVGTDVGNPPYVGFNTSKAHVYTARSGSVGIEVRAYDTTTGVVGSSVIDTIPSANSSFSNPCGDVYPNGDYILADDSTGVKFFDANNSYNAVSTLTSQGDFGELRNQAIKIGDTLMVITSDGITIRLWDVSNISSPVLLDSNTSYAAEFTFAYLEIG